MVLICINMNLYCVCVLLVLLSIGVVQSSKVFPEKDIHHNITLNITMRGNQAFQEIHYKISGADKIDMVHPEVFISNNGSFNEPSTVLHPDNILDSSMLTKDESIKATAKALNTGNQYGEINETSEETRNDSLKAQRSSQNSPSAGAGKSINESVSPNAPTGKSAHETYDTNSNDQNKTSMSQESVHFTAGERKDNPKKAQKARILRQIRHELLADIQYPAHIYAFLMSNEQFLGFSDESFYYIYKFHSPTKVKFMVKIEHLVFCKHQQQEGRNYLACSKVVGGYHAVVIYLVSSTRLGLSLKVLEEIGDIRCNDINMWINNGVLQMFIAVSPPDSAYVESSIVNSRLYALKDETVKHQTDLNAPASTTSDHFLAHDEVILVLPRGLQSSDSQASTTSLYRIGSEGKSERIGEVSSHGVVSVSAININNEESLICIASTCRPSSDECREDYIKLYLFTMDMLLEIQDLPVSGVSQCSFYENNGDIFLTVISKLTGVRIFRYQNDKFAELNILKELKRPGLTGLTYLSHFAVLAVTTSRESNSLPLLFIKVQMTSGNSAKKLKALRSQVHMCESSLKRSEDKIQKFVADLTQEITRRDFTVRLPRQTRQDSLHIASKKNDLEEIDEALRRYENQIIQMEKQISLGIDITKPAQWPDNLEFSSLLIHNATINNLITREIDEKVVPNIKDLIPIKDSSLSSHFEQKHFENIFIKKLKVKRLGDAPINMYITLNDNNTIYNRMKFNHISTNNLSVGGTIGGVNITKENILLKTAPQKISGSFSCRKATVIDMTTRFLNGIDLSELARQEDEQNQTVIRGNAKFMGDLFLQEASVGTVYGKDINEWSNNLLKKNSPKNQILSGQFTFKNFFTKKAEVETVNGYSFIQNTLINSPSRRYNIPHAIMNDVDVDDLVVLNGINDIRVVNNSLRVLTIKDDQIIFGKKKFHSIKLGKTAHELKNDTYVEQDDTLVSTALGNLKNELSEKEKIFEKYLSVWMFLEYLSGHRVHYNRQKRYSARQHDVTRLEEQLKWLASVIHNRTYLLEEDFTANNRLTTFRSTLISLPPEDSDRIYKIISAVIADIGKLMKGLNKENLKLTEEIREIEDTLLYSGIHRNFWKGGSRVTGLVNGVSIQDMKMFSKAHDYTLEQLRTAPQIILEGNLDLKRINGKDIFNLKQETVPLSAKRIKVPMVFHNNLKVLGNLNALQINGENVEDLATVNGYNLFVAPVNIKELICLNDVELKGTLNSLSIQKESELIARTNQANFFTEPINISSLKTNRLQCKSIFINGHRLEDVVQAHEDISIAGPIHFSKIHVSGQTVHGRNLTLNTWNYKEMSDILPSEIDGFSDDGKLKVRKIKVKGDLTVRGDISDGAYFDDFHRLIENSFRSSDDVTINGDLVFHGPVNVESLEFQDTFNGISAREFDQGLLQKSVSQTINNTMVFRNLHIHNVELTSGLLGGVDIGDLQDKTLKVDEDAVVFADMLFDEMVSPQIKVGGLVQGLNLTQDLVLKNEDVTFSGKKFFAGPTHARSRVTVHNTINSLDVDKMCRSVLGTLIVDGNLHLEKGLVVEHVGSGDVFIPTNQENSYWISDREATFHNPVYFNDLEAKSIYLRKNANGVPISELTKKIIPRNCKGPIETDVMIDVLRCTNLVVENLQVDSINGVDMDFLHDIVLNNTDQVFASNISVEGLSAENLITTRNQKEEIPWNLCRTDSNCFVKGEKRFKFGIKTEDFNLKTESKINGLSVNELLNFIRNPEKQIVIIERSLEVPSVRVEGLVNNLKINLGSVLTYSGDQYIPRNITISKPGQVALYAEEIVIKDGLFGDVNITELIIMKQENPELFQMNSHGEPQFVVNYIKKYEMELQTRTNYLLSRPISFGGWTLLNRIPGQHHIISSLDSDISGKGRRIIMSQRDAIQLWEFSVKNGRYEYSGITVKQNCSEDAKMLTTEEHDFLLISSSCRIDVPLGVEKIYSENMQAGEEFSLIWKISSGKLKLFAGVASQNASDIVVFDKNVGSCFLIVNEGASEQNVYCYRHGFFLEQTISIPNVFKAKLLNFKNGSRKINLLIVASTSTSESSKVSILRYDIFQRMFLLVKEFKMPKFEVLEVSSYKTGGFMAIITDQFCSFGKSEIRFFSIQPKNYRDVDVELTDIVSVGRSTDLEFMNFPTGNLVLIVLEANGKLTRMQEKHGRFTPKAELAVRKGSSLSSWEIQNIPVLAITPFFEGEICDDSAESVIYRGNFRGWIGNTFEELELETVNY